MNTRSPPPGLRRAPVLSTARGLVAAVFMVAVAATQGGCCNALKAPNRCAACVYDNCIIPYGSRAPGTPMGQAPRPSDVEAGAPRASAPVATMAY